MKILNGKVASDFLYEDLKKEIILYEKKRKPCLCIFLIGYDKASHTYVNAKKKKCEELGIICKINFFEEISEKNLIEEIEIENKNQNTDGIIVQLPIKLNTEKILDAINPEKDVDGFSSINYGKMSKGFEDVHIPATALGILELLNFYQIKIEGKHCVILGRGITVGSPLSILMSMNKESGNATVTLCHSKTKNLKNFTKKADILIVAIGKAKFIDDTFVKKNSVIIDVGINKIEDLSSKKGYKIVGDVDFEKVYEKVSHISPVPFGVGPMTIYSLLENTIKSYKNNI
jgi:methylenetetrahydrofolate dehydrogenase (NADP+)/methenyltetrahydrofolate cyclohydrolase